MEYQNELLTTIINDIIEDVLDYNNYKKNIHSIHFNNFECSKEELLLTALEYCQNEIEDLNDFILDSLFHNICGKNFDKDDLICIFNIESCCLRDYAEQEHGLALDEIEELIKEHFDDAMRSEWFYKIDFNELRDYVIYEKASEDTNDFFEELVSEIAERLANEITNHDLFEDVQEAYVLSVKI